MTEYIEKEAAKQEVKRFIGYLDEDMIYRINVALNRLPAADVRENVHGEWISTKTNVYPACYAIQCSVCNFIAFYSGIEDNNKDCGYNFCPNCGRKMLKEVKK